MSFGGVRLSGVSSTSFLWLLSALVSCNTGDDLVVDQPAIASVVSAEEFVPHVYGDIPTTGDCAEYRPGQLPSLVAMDSSASVFTWLWVNSTPNGELTAARVEWYSRDDSTRTVVYIGQDTYPFEPALSARNLLKAQWIRTRTDDLFTIPMGRELYEAAVALLESCVH